MKLQRAIMAITIDSILPTARGVLNINQQAIMKTNGPTIEIELTDLLTKPDNTLVP